MAAVDPITAIAQAAGESQKTLQSLFSGITQIFTSADEVKIAQKKVDNTKVLLNIEQEKGETAEALAQIDLLKKRLDLEITELNNQLELEKQKQTGSLATIFFVLIFLVFIVFLVLKFLKPEPMAAPLPTQTILIQE